MIIDNTYSKELLADPILENYRRQVLGAAFSYVEPVKPSHPQLVHVSSEMIENIGLSNKEVKSKEFLDWVSGNDIYPNTKPYAMNYGGHQFGNWAGQLGDGRAINLFEAYHKNKRWMLQLKGAGPTPYSRQGDGLAVLRSSIREYLCSEAMYHLGVPTTRALSLVLTGDQVMRDMMYDGHAAYEPGAIVCRVAPTFIRFGNFEIFAARQDVKNLKALADYTIKYFYPELGTPSKTAYLNFFKEVTNRTLEMIIHWQRVGFVHGVMNTDNMSILGLTIDYGPYGWLEGFDFGWTPNTTDAEHKRYRYGNQPNVGLWNLLQLANALYPLIEDSKALQDILNGYRDTYEKKFLEMLSSKIGLSESLPTDKLLIQTLEDNLMLTETDMTIFFRNLSQFQKNNPEDGWAIIKEAFYEDVNNEETIKKWNHWFNNYATRLQKESKSDSDRAKQMNQINPKYVLRNYMAQLAIDDAETGNYSLLEKLFNLLKQPYEEQPEKEKWFAKRPDWARHKIGCSMLSCSS